MRHLQFQNRHEGKFISDQFSASYVPCNRCWQVQSEGDGHGPSHKLVSVGQLAGAAVKTPPRVVSRRLAICVADGGQILIDKGHSFRFEKGEWQDPRAYLEV